MSKDKQGSKLPISYRLGQFAVILVTITCVVIAHFEAAAYLSWYPRGSGSMFVVPSIINAGALLIFIVSVWLKGRDRRTLVITSILSVAAFPLLWYVEVYGFYALRVFLS